MDSNRDQEAIMPYLASVGPHPDLAPEDQLFVPFMGSWDLDVDWLENGRVVRSEVGEWHFAWMLEGRAIQDVWIVPSIAERAAGNSGYEYGTSVRFHDPDIGGWRSIWVGPVRRSVELFIAKRVETDIVLETGRADGRSMKWVFSDVGPTCFIWRNFLQQGQEWELTQRFSARRRGLGVATAASPLQRTSQKQEYQ